jgi:biotin transport system substrate-specific component
MPNTRIETAPVVGGWSRASRRALAIGIGALIVAIAARIIIPVPGSPVPFTLQDLAVLAIGGVAGPVAGAGALLLYLGLGAAGLPVFAGGMSGLPYLLGPTAGYLFAFPLAAWVTGRVAGDTLGRAALAALLGLLVIHAGGVSWLALQTGDSAAALRLGSLPFLASGVVKVGLAAGIIRSLRPRVRPVL